MSALDEMQNRLKVQEGLRNSVAKDLQGLLEVRELRLYPTPEGTRRRALQAEWKILPCQGKLLHLHPVMQEELRRAVLDPFYGMSETDRIRAEGHETRTTTGDYLHLELWEAARRNFEAFLMERNPELEPLSQSLRLLIPSVSAFVFYPRVGTARPYKSAMQLLLPRTVADVVEAGPPLFSVNELITEEGQLRPDWVQVPSSDEVVVALEKVIKHLFETLAMVLLSARDLDMRKT